MVSTPDETPLRLTPRAKIPHGVTRRIWLLTDLVRWQEHWLHNRSWICPGDDCPACETWTAKPMAAALGRIDRKQGLRLLIAPEERWPAAKRGTIVRVAGDKAGSKIEIVGRAKPKKSETLADIVVWDCLATMHRLPMDGGDHDAAIRKLLAAARRQLTHLLNHYGGER